MRPGNWQSFPLPSRAETRAFITSDESKEAEELWNSSSGLSGLLRARKMGTAKIVRPRGEADYEYNPLTGQYRNATTGRVVSERQLRSAVLRVSNAAQRKMRDNTRQLISGTVLFMIWYERSRSIIKALYRAVWTVSLGGLLFDDQTMREFFYLFTLAQFERFDTFTRRLDNYRADLLNGNALTQAGSYGRYGNALYQNIKLESGKAKGHKQARRVLGENEDHCEHTEETPGCIELADMGWVPIEIIVPLGGATCRANCMCQIETR